MNPDTYTVRTRCRNCKEEGTHEMPRGVSMANYTIKVECPYCGCDMTLQPLKD